MGLLAIYNLLTTHHDGSTRTLDDQISLETHGDIVGSTIPAHSIKEHQDVPDLSVLSPSFNNNISALWVKKGYKVIGYDNFNYSTQLIEKNGFEGDNCNEYGCYYDLTGTSANNDISSIKCDRDIRTSTTWGDCILVDRGAGDSYSFKGNHSTLNGGAWSNRAHLIYVKNGYEAVVYPDEDFEINAPPYTEAWGQVDWEAGDTFTGTSGDWCNSYGCMHDLVGTLQERTISSLQCSSI